MTPATPPRATYRLQLGPGLDFVGAAALTEYLRRLGVSHLYLSPMFQARRGSSHGYDIADHNQISVELGGDIGLFRLSERLVAADLGLLVDFVPNHMGISHAANPWWDEVLAWGQRSPRSEFFDIDWRPAVGHLVGKVLVPMLGDHYGAVLERGELEIVFEAGAFAVHYFDHRYPLHPPSYAMVFGTSAGSPALDAILAELRGLGEPDADAVLAGGALERAAELQGQLAELAATDPLAADAIARALADINAEPGRQRLHQLLEAQKYRLAYYRVAADEINYRRFFNINELAGLRVEIDEVFDRVHARLFELVAEGVVGGVRIDHIDGLFDPAGYLRRLRAGARERGLEPYIVVEKILAEHEHLRPDWECEGTTGYEFLSEVIELLVDRAAEKPLHALYRRQVGRSQTTDLEQAFYEAKCDIIDDLLAAELQVLATTLDRISERNNWTRDFTLLNLREALRQAVASFPVYRTYVSAESEASEDDRRDIAWAVALARKRAPRIDSSVFDFIERAMLCELPGGLEAGYDPLEVRRFALKLQQYTGPVMAKAIEDTAFYRHPILLALNDVGTDPRRFGGSVAGFHVRQQRRAQHHPSSMLTTSTHDTKRGEDARARIAALSEIPELWAERVGRWNQLNRSRRRPVGDRRSPSRAEAYLLYQAMIGSWPVELVGRAPAELDRDHLAAFATRLSEYAIKALREAKQSSSWDNPDAAYEDAVTGFIAKILEGSSANVFLDDFAPFAAEVAERGMYNSLSQLVLKLTVPGVPDIYQGSELWDLSLVDPDNRRPVDFERRGALLDEIERLDPERAGELLETWSDGRIKLYLLHRLLGLRAARPALFASGDYHPLPVEGRFADRAVAFERTLGDQAIIVCAARLTGAVAASGERPVGERWGDTSIPGDHLAGIERLAGRTIAAEGGRVRLAELFATLPVAVVARAM
jgi:(1->4)-alpha-D-glucan 1-alpha-D-glucosylmutase